jgi:hypothetical protein
MDIQVQLDQSTQQDAYPEGRLVPVCYATRRVVQSHVYLKSERPIHVSGDEANRTVKQAYRHVCYS